MKYTEKTADDLKVEIDNLAAASNNYQVEIDKKKKQLADLDKEIKAADKSLADTLKKSSDARRQSEIEKVDTDTILEKKHAVQKELKEIEGAVAAKKSEFAELTVKVQEEQKKLEKERDNFNVTMAAIKNKAKRELDAANAILA